MNAQNPPIRKAGTSLKALLDEREKRYATILVHQFYQRLGMSMANANANANERVAARALLSLAAYRNEQFLGPNNLETQAALNLLALHDFNTGDFASALSTYEKLHASCRATWGSGDRLTRIAGIRVRVCQKHLRSPLYQPRHRASLS